MRDDHGRRIAPADAPPGGVLVAALTAAVAVGVLDAALQVAASPDPGSASYRVGYVVGPLLADATVGLLVGLALRAARASRWTAAAMVAGAWAATIAAAGRARGDGPAATVLLLLALAIAGAGATRIAARAAAAWTTTSPRRRRVVAASATAMLLAGMGAAAPAGIESFRGGTGPCPAETATNAPRGPNVVLITVDSLRADVARRTRTYRRLAADGRAFTEYFVDAPWTLPSMASLLTGRPFYAHGAGAALSSSSILMKRALVDDADTIAATFGRAGYRTHAIVTNPFLTARYGVDRGFCTFENLSMAGEAARGVGQSMPLRLVALLAPQLLPSDRAGAVGARAAAWLDVHADRPFLLWLHFLDPHAPYGDRDGASTSLTFDLLAFESRAQLLEAPFRATGKLRAGEYRPDERERARILDYYLDDVAYLDDQLETLLDALERRRLLARTVVVFTADHGEEFWDHGGVEHGRSLYDEVLRVPLVVCAPGTSPGASARFATVLDVAPTIAALAGVPQPAGSAGRDLLAGDVDSAPLVLGNMLFGEEWAGVRSPTHAYARSAAGTELLFDVGRDPGEQRNVASSEPDLADAGRATLAAHGALAGSAAPPIAAVLAR